eukprot:g2323.t1
MSRTMASMMMMMIMIVMMIVQIVPADGTTIDSVSYAFRGCFAHRSGNLIEEWDTSGRTVRECAMRAFEKSEPWFVMEFPQGYSALFEEPVASCGFRGVYWSEGEIDPSLCGRASFGNTEGEVYLGGPSILAVYVRESELITSKVCEREEGGGTNVNSEACRAYRTDASSAELERSNSDDRDIRVAYWPEDRPNQFEMLDHCGVSEQDTLFRCRRQYSSINTSLSAQARLRATFDADIVFFSTDGVRVRLPEKRPGQFFAAFTAQGRPFLFDRMDDRAFADAMDLHFHYDPARGDVWLPWLPCRRRAVGGLSASDVLGRPISDDELWTRTLSRRSDSRRTFVGHEDASVATFVSNCAHDRLETIDRIERYSPGTLQMDHYGRCNRNVASLPSAARSEKEGGSYESAFREKMEILQQYRIALVFENVHGVRHYVTEKIFHALAAGALPVYSGAPPEDVEALLPCHDCVVFADHFASADALAKHLTHLLKDRDAYLAHFRWKRERTLRASFLAHMQYCESNFRLQQGCMACERLIESRGRGDRSFLPLRFSTPR